MRNEKYVLEKRIASMRRVTTLSFPFFNIFLAVPFFFQNYEFILTL